MNDLHAYLYLLNKYPMKLFNMIISILLALDIVAGPAAGNTTGNELIKKYIETSIVQEQIKSFIDYSYILT